MELRMTATTAPETTGRASEGPKTPLASRITDALGGPFRSIPVLLTLVVIWALFYSQNSAYLSFANITNLTLQIVTTAILALGIVFVLLVGEIDLSVAALSGVCATVAANLSVNMGWPLAAGIAAGVVVGLVVVFIEAQIIIFGVPSLIVTLGGMVILQGLLLVVLPPEFTVSVGGTTYAKIASSRVPTGVSLAIAFVGSAIYCYSRLRTQRDRRGSVAAPAMTTSVILPAVGPAVVIFATAPIPCPAHFLPPPCTFPQ